MKSLKKRSVYTIRDSKGLPSVGPKKDTITIYKINKGSQTQELELMNSDQFFEGLEDVENYIGPEARPIKVIIKGSTIQGMDTITPIIYTASLILEVSYTNAMKLDENNKRLVEIDPEEPLTPKKRLEIARTSQCWPTYQGGKAIISSISMKRKRIKMGEIIQPRRGIAKWSIYFRQRIEGEGSIIIAISSVIISNTRSKELRKLRRRIQVIERPTLVTHKQWYKSKIGRKSRWRYKRRMNKDRTPIERQPISVFETQWFSLNDSMFIDKDSITIMDISKLVKGVDVILGKAFLLFSCSKDGGIDGVSIGQINLEVITDPFIVGIEALEASRQRKYIQTIAECNMLLPSTKDSPNGLKGRDLMSTRIKRTILGEEHKIKISNVSLPKERGIHWALTIGLTFAFTQRKPIIL